MSDPHLPSRSVYTKPLGLRPNLPKDQLRPKLTPLSTFAALQHQNASTMNVLAANPDDDVHAMEQKMLNDVGLFRHQGIVPQTVEALLKERQQQRKEEERSGGSSVTGGKGTTDHTDGTHALKEIWPKKQSWNLSHVPLKGTVSRGRTVVHNDTDSSDAGGGNFGLITAMTSRLSSLEHSQAKMMTMLREKDAHIEQLNSKIEALSIVEKQWQKDVKLKAHHGASIQMNKGPSSLVSEEIVATRKETANLKKQVQAMEQFLSDYGLVWVGYRAGDEENAEKEEADEGEEGEEDEEEEGEGEREEGEEVQGNDERREGNDEEEEDSEEEGVEKDEKEEDDDEDDDDEEGRKKKCGNDEDSGMDAKQRKLQRRMKKGRKVSTDAVNLELTHKKSSSIISACMGDEQPRKERKARKAAVQVPTRRRFMTGKSKDEAVAIYFDMKKMLASIKDLNQLAGDGKMKVVQELGVHKLKPQESVSLTFYHNGIWFKNGPLRAYNLPECQSFCQDLLDGYFPFELKEHYPDGVVFDVIDKSTCFFLPASHPQSPRNFKAFSGVGNRLADKHADRATVDTSAVPLLLPRPSTPIKVPPGVTVTSEPPSKPLSTVQFLSRLPKQRIVAGKVVEIRSGIANKLAQPEGKNSSSAAPRGSLFGFESGNVMDIYQGGIVDDVILVPTPALERIQRNNSTQSPFDIVAQREPSRERVVPLKLSSSVSKPACVPTSSSVSVSSLSTAPSSEQSCSPRVSMDIATLKVKLDRGHASQFESAAPPALLVKLQFEDTIGILKKVIQGEREKLGMTGAFDLKTTFPNRIYSENLHTLKECGLTPNAMIIVQTVD